MSGTWKKILKRLKVASIVALLALGVVLRDFALWAVALVQAGVTFGVMIGPLMKAANRLGSDLFMFPVRLILAVLILFGIGSDWVCKAHPEAMEFVKNDLAAL